MTVKEACHLCRKYYPRGSWDKHVAQSKEDHKQYAVNAADPSVPSQPLQPRNSPTDNSNETGDFEEYSGFGEPLPPFDGDEPIEPWDSMAQVGISQQRNGLQASPRTIAYDGAGMYILLIV